MDDSLQNIGIKELGSIIGAGPKGRFGEDFFIKEIHYDSSENLLRHPVRFDGYLGIFCVSGGVKVEINTGSYEVGPRSFMVCVPGYMIRIPELAAGEDKGLNLVVVAMSPEFVPSIRLDLGNLWGEGMKVLESPVITLSEEEFALCRGFLDMCQRVMESPLEDKKGPMSHLLASLMQIFGQVWRKTISSAMSQPPAMSSSRGKLIFEQFLRLVTEYHTTQRGMAFYAERMSLTPKYLSKLVKKASGRTAPQWIDSFVVLESKNMLKYSDMSIKQIVYALHFPNQSVFYKFFKTQTGMTPSQYRNS